MTTQAPTNDAPAAGEDTGAPAAKEAEATAATAEAAEQADDQADEGADESTVMDRGAEGEAKEGEAEAVETFTLTAPDGFEALDTEALEAATPLLKEMGVTTDEKAQEVVNQFAPVVAGIVQRAREADQAALSAYRAETHATWAKECLAHPDLGNGSEEKLNEAASRAAKFRDTFGTDALKQFLNESGVGNHPELVAAFAKAGEALSESGFHLGGSGSLKPKESWERAYDPAFHPRQE